MSLSLGQPQIAVVRGQHDFTANPNTPLTTLFPGISQEKLAELQAILQLDGYVQEQRIEFQISGGSGILTYYNIAYNPGPKTLRWRAIQATVAIPTVYSSQWGVVGQKWRGAAIWGRKKNVEGWIQVPRGLTAEEIAQVSNHLMGSIRLAIEAAPGQA